LGPLNAFCNCNYLLFIRENVSNFLGSHGLGALTDLILRNAIERFIDVLATSGPGVLLALITENF
jgi:hypothetical protein